MKIKGTEYLRLHKIMTNVSTTGIWEMLKNGDDVTEILKDVPDEFYNKIKLYVKDLKYFYHLMYENVGKKYDYFMYGKYNDKDPIENKKVYAEWVFTQPKHLQPILFKMFDKKDYSEIIWKLIKPEFRKL
jgi:RNA ligase